MKGRPVAVVTGTSRGLGVAIAEDLLSVGYDVVGISRSASPIRHERFVHSPADISKRSASEELVEGVVDRFGRIDILVNNAGGAVKIASTEEQTDAAIDAAIALNLNSVIYGCRRVAPLMRKQGSGIIVNIGSVAGHHAWPTWGVYGAAKAGLNHFSKSLYLELRPHGVRVTTITPSWGATTFTDAAGLGPRDVETLAKCIKPEEIGQIVADVCALPAHLCIQETILWPMVQEVNPL